MASYYTTLKHVHHLVFYYRQNPRLYHITALVYIMYFIQKTCLSQGTFSRRDKYWTIL